MCHINVLTPKQSNSTNTRHSNFSFELNMHRLTPSVTTKLIFVCTWDSFHSVRERDHWIVMSCNSDCICINHLIIQHESWIWFWINFHELNVLPYIIRRLLFSCCHLSVYSVSFPSKSALGSAQSMSLISLVLGVEVSPFTWALIRRILFYLCRPCCFKNDDRVGVHLPKIVSPIWRSSDAWLFFS